MIFVDGGSYTMGIARSMFYNCACSSYGGAIYFSSLDAILRMICANRCLASYYHFAYIRASQNNIGEFLSVSSCSHSTSGYYPIYFQNGNQKVDNTNSSMNNALRYSGISIDSPSSFRSTFFTFSNNKVSQYVCLYFASNSGNLSFANIVHINSPSAFGIVYISGGTPKMNYCIFDMNQNTLFCVNSGSLDISHSIISLSGSLSTSTAVSIANNNSFSKKETYGIPFYKSLFCFADIPLLMETPEITLNDTDIEATPYRSYDDNPFGESGIVFPTPHESLFPEITPHQSLFPEHTPHQSLFPFQTEQMTNPPERTNQRSFPEDFIERTPFRTTEIPNNSLDLNLSNGVFAYSTVALSLIVVIFIINTMCSRQKTKNMESSSSSSLSFSMNGEKIEDVVPVKPMTQNNRNPNPYVF